MFARRIWLSVLVAVFLTIAGARVTAAQDETPEPAKPSILIDSIVTYRLRPDQGVLHGTLQFTVTRPKDGSLVFDRVLVPLVKGAANASAVADDGRTLQTTVETRLDRPYAGASVQFGHQLAQGEAISFHVDYDLTPVRIDQTIVSDSFVYIPIFAIGQSVKVTIELPNDGIWYSAVEAADCKRQGAIAQEQFVCSGSSDVYDVAQVQLTDLTGYGTLDMTVQTGGGAQALKLRYLPGDAGWASHVRSLVTRGLPVLEGVIGSPLKLREDFTMLEVGSGELGGYEGIFQCLEAQLCRIGVVEGAADQIVLHELAHLWTTKYDERWLAEGIAEFSAEKAAGQMGLPVEQAFGPPYTEPIYLQEWSKSLLFGPVTRDAALRELAGYRESVLLFGDLEKAAGMGAIQQANAKSEAEGDIDSKDYLDFLEAASSTDLVPLFRERVFPPSFSPTLQRRAQAKDALAGLMYFTANSEYAIQPAAIETAIDDWEFFTALDAVDHARTFMKDFPLAQDEQKHVSLWQHLGLIGKDPAGNLTLAKAAFDKGDYTIAGQKARSAENDYSTASQSARDRVLFAFAALVVIAVLYLGATWARQGHAEAEH
jgi:hypothetical protein